MSIRDAAMFQTTANDAVIIAPCLEIVLNLDLTNDEGLLDFYDRSRQALGERISHYQSGTMKGFNKLTPKAESMVPTWFGAPAKGKLDYYMSLSQGDPNQQASASTISMMVFRRPAEELTEKVKKEWASTYEKYGRQAMRAATELRLTLPLDHPLAEPEALTAWISELKILQEGTSFTGYCGLALNQFNQAALPSLNGPAQQALASLVLRHPGLGWTGASTAENNPYDPKTNEFRLLLKRANWLNVLCDHTLDVLGGRSAVLAHLPAHSSLQATELKYGLAIKAGNTPQIGDIPRRDFISAYRELAAIIKPVRLPKIGGLGPSFMPGATNEWLNAFDKQYE